MDEKPTTDELALRCCRSISDTQLASGATDLVELICRLIQEHNDDLRYEIFRELTDMGIIK